MRRLRAGVVGLIVALGCAAPAAGAEPAGFSLTIDVPPTYRAGTPFSVSGYLRAHAEAPIVFEYAHGLPSQTVELLVDGVVVATDETNNEGAYLATVQFGWEAPTTRTIQVRAFTGYPFEEVSPSVDTRLDRVFIGLEVRPASLALRPGDAIALSAWAEDSDGRFSDVTGDAEWTSSDAAVAEVSDTGGTRGTVTAIAPGAATVSVAFRGLAATVSVSVV